MGFRQRSVNSGLHDDGAGQRRASPGPSLDDSAPSPSDIRNGSPATDSCAVSSPDSVGGTDAELQVNQGASYIGRGYNLQLEATNISDSVLGLVSVVAVASSSCII
jgi:hypothetical protein